MIKVEIIIPAFNAHKTIEKTLESIQSQVINIDYHITIVNDCGKSYSNIIKKYINKIPISEITTNKNVGPGQARQFGIDSTSSKYIIFIDSDDCFQGNAIDLLYNEIEKSNADLVVSNFLYKRDNEQIIKKEDLVWLHGKIYRRSFIEKNNIRFNNTRANEDNGFNRLIILLDPVVVFLNKLTYVYNDNKNSITRRNNRLYKFTGLEGYVYNINWAIEEGIKRKATNKGIAMTLIGTLYALYNYYLELYNSYDVEKILEWSKELYKKYNIYKNEIIKYEDSSIKILEKDYKFKDINKFISFNEFKEKINKLL